MKHVLLTMMVAASPLAIGVAHAQAPADEGLAGEAPANDIVVTGSRLRQTDLVSASPVTVMDRAEIDTTGAQSVGELLRELPVASPSASESAGRGNSGAANVALRGLSAVNTLVLVNGRRMISNNASGTVDLNSIPFEAVERVEVLQNGASAVYGTDAVAGVVNIIMRRSFDGLQIKAGAGVSDRGDLPTRDISLTFGDQFDDGGFVFNASYRSSGGNAIGDRPVSRDPDWRSRGGRNWRDSAPTSTALRGIDPANPDMWYVLRDGVARGQSLADFRPYVFPGTGDPLSTGNDGINYWQYESSASEIEQYNLWFAGEKEITSGVNAFVEVSYNRRESLGYLAPDYFDTWNDYTIDANNDYNTFGVDLDVSRTLLETLRTGPTRAQNITSNVMRYVAGLEGKVFGNFDWELAVNYQDLDLRNDGGRTLERARLEAALGDSDVCRTIAGCVPLDLFGATGTVTDEMLHAITAQRWSQTDASLTSVTGNVSGTLVDLWAGPLDISIGGEFRRETYREERDNAPDKETPTPLFAPQARKVSEIYGELRLPLLRDVPLVQLLDIDAAVRYSHYNQFGSTTNPQIGLRWRPVNDLMIRGSWGTAFRAPNFTEANPQQSRGYRPLVDPCQGDNFASLPGCNGVQAPVVTGAWVISGGNPDLRPETAENYTLGFVYTPDYLPGFSWTVDAWRIEKSDIIGTADPNYIIAENAAGTSFGGAVSRFPDNSLEEVYSIRENLLALRVQGIDAAVEYTTPRASWGRLNGRLDVTYMDSYKSSPAAGAEPVERVGTYTTSLSTLAKWRGTARLTYQGDDLMVSWGARYVDGVTNEASLLVDGEFLEAKSYIQHDLQVSYDIGGEPSARLTFGVENLFDRMPPWLEGNYYNGFDANTFNSRGRFFYARAEAKF